MGVFTDQLFHKKGFTVTCELIPGRGFKGKNIDRIMDFVEAVKQNGEVHALSLTDNAGGNPALSADVLGAEIAARGIDVIVHFTCKDMNRNFIESRAYSLQRNGLENLLVMTGDYPVTGFFGLTKPVFDIDSVSALQYLKEMNEGLYIQKGRNGTVLEKTNFILGAVVSPYKYIEPLSVMQYYKLEKKLYAGADYVITQVGYDTKKLKELIVFLRNILKTEVPVLGSVYLLGQGAASAMNSGEIPGCYVDDRLLDLVRRESKSADKGKKARLVRAAKQIAVLRGLGYAGAHIEGSRLRYEDVRSILEMADRFASEWEEAYTELTFVPGNPYYIFPESFLTKPGGTGPVPEFIHERKPHVRSPAFWMTRILHKIIFTEGTPGYMVMKDIIFFIKKNKLLYKLFSLFEKIVKKPLFDCRECDDCTLFETYYICPESKCPKGMRIGPCGGTRQDGMCEVFPDQPCIWLTIYNRAKNRGETGKLRYIIPPRDWALYKTNSWVNYFMKNDHSCYLQQLPDNKGL